VRGRKTLQIYTGDVMKKFLGRAVRRLKTWEKLLEKKLKEVDKKAERLVQEDIADIHRFMDRDV